MKCSQYTMDVHGPRWRADTEIPEDGSVDIVETLDRYWSSSGRAGREVLVLK